MTMDERETIRDLYRAYWRGMIAGDVEALRRHMAEDYFLQHMTGVRRSREEFLRGLRDGTFRYFSAEHEAIEVTVCGDTASIVGRSRCWQRYTVAENTAGGCGAISPCGRKTKPGASQAPGRPRIKRRKNVGIHHPEQRRQMPGGGHRHLYALPRGYGKQRPGGTENGLFPGGYGQRLRQ